jgi:uncharacterized protein YeaO (DUF488 family)
VPLLTKRVKESRTPEDGTRILVMRLWPRGVKKEHFDAWERDLAPSVELVRSFLGGALTWGEYRKQYLAEVRSRARGKIALLRERLKAGETITVLCWCQDESRCHRSLVRELLEKGRRKA